MLLCQTSKWVPQKHWPTPPPTNSSASLLHFSAQQRSCGLVLSRRCHSASPGQARAANRPSKSGQGGTVLHKHTSCLFVFPQSDVNNVRCIHPHLPGNVTRKELSESGSAFGRRFPSLCRQRGVKVEQSASLMQPLHRGSRGALICSPTGTSERILGSSSLDEDAAALPHGRLKREARGAAAAKGLSGVS